MLNTKRNKYINKRDTITNIGQAITHLIKKTPNFHISVGN